MVSMLNYGWPFYLITLGTALIMLGISFRLLLAGRTSKKPVSTILKTTDLGMIRVSVNTLDTLTQKAVRSFQDVKEVKSMILPEQDGGVRVQLKVTILPDVHMPELTQNIQIRVKEYVEELSGITVKEVQVYIDNLTIAKQNRVE
jgi:molybdenum cofactor biosynthesis enzyme MoaA